jgi:hypothetical protein
MIPEPRVRHSADEERILGLPWRCVNCGNVLDSVIIRNRAVRADPAAPIAWSGKGKVVEQDVETISLRRGREVV